ncbi:hypothetical protein RND71_041892 [Anisodus tanguticus]|uniref:Uncharacterized protein n=1 Tax=Anisodus tanguticus TaxID=243964 RepID=A0AAE1QVI1_9SOLA|nr:hypothetical protein RND71_041892 [Anisodus tanguticus]
MAKFPTKRAKIQENTSGYMGHFHMIPIVLIPQGHLICGDKQHTASSCYNYITFPVQTSEQEQFANHQTPIYITFNIKKSWPIFYPYKLNPISPFVTSSYDTSGNNGIVLPNGNSYFCTEKAPVVNNDLFGRRRNACTCTKNSKFSG